MCGLLNSNFSFSPYKDVFLFHLDSLELFSEDVFECLWLGFMVWKVVVLSFQLYSVCVF